MFNLRALYLSALIFGCYSHQNYGDPENWPGLCRTGTSQSPIDIDEEAAIHTHDTDTTFHVHFDQFNRSPFKVPVHFKVTSNEYDVKIEPLPSNQQLVLQFCRPYCKKYVLDSIHFHKDSEHTLSKKRFPLESHQIYRQHQYDTLEEALKVRGSVTVLASFYEVGLYNKGLCNFFKTIPKAGQTININLNPLHFVPHHRRCLRYYVYDGSLTTPNCTEGITWIVFKDRLHISAEQMQTFDNMPNNARGLQELNGRTVSYNKMVPVFH